MIFRIVSILLLFLVCILLELPISASFSHHVGHYANTVEQITEFPLDFQDTETTTGGYTLNVTLDTRLVNDTNAYWGYSSLRVKKWFEYYNDTDHLIALKTNESTCAPVISNSTNQLELEDRNGIWVTCQDATLNADCLVRPPCYPEIKYTFGNAQLQLRTVKIYLALQGLAIVRLVIGAGATSDFPTCFDYSRRKDPFSRCKHIKVDSTGEWEMVRSGFDGYDNQFFSSFTVSLIARFKNDVALIDKIEATDFLLCGYEEGNCTTTPPGPPRSTPSTATLNSTTVVTTEGPTTTRRGRVTTLPPVNTSPSSASVLARNLSTCLLLSTLLIYFV